MPEDRATQPGATTTTEVGGVAGERSTVARLTEDVPTRAGAAATAETAIAAPAAGERLSERRSRAAATTEAALTPVPCVPAPAAASAAVASGAPGARLGQQTAARRRIARAPPPPPPPAQPS